MKLLWISLAALAGWISPLAGSESPRPAAPGTIRVGPAGDEGYRELSGEAIQRALDALRGKGGTVVLAAGEYRIRADGISLKGSKEGLTVLGEPGARLVFEPASTARVGGVISIEDSEDVSILRVEIEGCAGSAALRICSSSRILIAHAVLRRGKASGIEIEDGRGCSITGSLVEGFSIAVEIRSGSGNIFTRNTIRGATKHAFFLGEETAGNTLADNLIAGESAPSIVDRGTGNLAVAGRPLFSFGAIADVQYAGKESRGPRRYREALGKLRRAVEALDRLDLDFLVDLGDLVDGNGERSLAELDEVLAEYGRSRHRRFHVVGNHCLAAVGREALLRRLGLEKAYREVARKGWRLIFLDGMELSLEAPRESETYRKAEAFLKLNPWAGVYSGALGEEQRMWLRAALGRAAEAGEKVLIFCHLPILEGQSSKDLLLWDHEEVARTIEDSGCVAACFSGHDHAGGYAKRKGTHFLTLPGLVEAPEGENAFAQVQVHDGFLLVSGYGTVPSRLLEMPGRDERKCPGEGPSTK